MTINNQAFDSQLAALRRTRYGVVRSGEPVAGSLEAVAATAEPILAHDPRARGSGSEEPAVLAPSLLPEQAAPTRFATPPEVATSKRPGNAPLRDVIRRPAPIQSATLGDVLATLRAATPLIRVVGGAAVQQ